MNPMDIIKHRIEITLKIFSTLARIFLYSVIPFTLTILSMLNVRYIPTVVGNLCGPTGEDLCYRSLPQAGFPFSYWIDQGGVSIMGQLGGEDGMFALAFGADFLVYFLIVLLIDILIKRWRKRRQVALSS